jgi:glucose/arabinose dehydrogenase
LSTEHGPRGGDEINSLIKGKNYGWPIASYGRSYYNKELMYKKSHELESFEEPIYSFIPSIGISEIIQVSSNFWRNYSITNLFFVSSLNGRSLFQIKFDNKFERVTFVEKIFIGQRIRDLKYIETNKALVLALEKPNKIAVMRSR